MGTGYWFTQDVHNVLAASRCSALARGAEFVGVPDLIEAFGQVPAPHARSLLAACGLSETQIGGLFPAHSPSSVPKTGSDIAYGSELKTVLECMMRVASPRQESRLGTGHLLAGLFASGHPLTAPLHTALGPQMTPERFLGVPTGHLAGEALPPTTTEGGHRAFRVLQFVPSWFTDWLVAKMPSDQEPPSA